MDGTESNGINFKPVIGEKRGQVGNGTPYPKPTRSIPEAAKADWTAKAVPNADEIKLPNPNQG